MTHRLHIVNDGGYVVEGEVSFYNVDKEIVDSFTFDKTLFETKTVDIPNEAVIYNLTARSTTNEDNIWQHKANSIYKNCIKFVGTEWAKDPIKFYHDKKYW